MPNSRIKLAIAGAEYGDWYSADTESNVFTPADAFHVSAAFPDDFEFFEVFREGVSLDLYADDDRLLAGVIDTVGGLSEGDRSEITIAGRDKGAYLTDNEAKHIKASDYTLKTLAEALIQPEWGIKSVIITNADNRKLALGKKDKKSKAGRGRQDVTAFLPRASTKIDPGARISNILDERTRQLGVTWWMTVDGSLFLGKPTYDQEVAYEFRAYKPGTDLAKTRNNCSSINFERSIEGRYSKITMGAQAAKGVEKFKAVAIDQDLVDRGIKRELIVVDNDSLHNDEVQKHVDYDMQVRRLSAMRLSVEFPSLRYEENDRLFAVDTLAHVVWEEARIDATFYVTARRNRVSKTSERTTISLVPPGVWLP